MPELPEVESVVQGIKNSGLIGQNICALEVGWEKILPQGAIFFKKSLIGKAILGVVRRGKYIIWRLSDCYVVIHLRMSGQFLMRSDEPKLQRHEHLALSFANGYTLYYKDTRKFGKWHLTSDAYEFLKKLGKEPFDPLFTPEYLHNAISTKNSSIKIILLNQDVVAGLGNIYVDESLWKARISPLRKASSLTKEEIKELHKAIIAVLRQAIAHKGTSIGNGIGNYKDINGATGKNQNRLSVYGKKGALCLNCQTPLLKIVCGQRGTTYCHICQI